MSRKKFAEMSLEEREALAIGISELRESMGITQGELAKLAGVSRQSISNIERGESVPSGKNLTAIMLALGVDEAKNFDPHIEKWLVMIGQLVENIPDSRRAKAMDATQQFLLLSAVADINDFALAASQDNYDAESLSYQEEI